MEIDRSQYCQVHLDQFQRIFHQKDWFEFLDSPNRAMSVVKQSFPPRMDDPISMSDDQAT